MKYLAFTAVCPFEIGDTIRINGSVKEGNVILQVLGVMPGMEVHEITDIICIQSLKKGNVRFQYELDNDGKYVNIIN